MVWASELAFHCAYLLQLMIWHAQFCMRWTVKPRSGLPLTVPVVDELHPRDSMQCQSHATLELRREFALYLRREAVRFTPNHSHVAIHGEAYV